jgi:hypothetical protein
MRSGPALLALLALLVVGAAIMAGLAGRDRATPQRPAAAADPGERSAKPGARDKPPRDPLLELGARYALAARNWTPSTYGESWQKQIALAGGDYRRELEAKRPGSVELRALLADRARSKARLVHARRDPRVRVPDARVLISLHETTVAAGDTIRGLTVNRVELRRRAGGWEVVGFTVLPGGATAGSGS